MEVRRDASAARGRSVASLQGRHGGRARPAVSTEHRDGQTGLQPGRLGVANEALQVLGGMGYSQESIVEVPLAPNPWLILLPAASPRYSRTASPKKSSSAASRSGRRPGPKLRNGVLHRRRCLCSSRRHWRRSNAWSLRRRWSAVSGIQGLTFNFRPCSSTATIVKKQLFTCRVCCCGCPLPGP